jgi:hypothetical protein
LLDGATECREFSTHPDDLRIDGELFVAAPPAGLERVVAKNGN